MTAITIRNWIKRQEALGFPTFSSEGIHSQFESMPSQQIKNDLYRLSKGGIIYSPYKGFYTVVPVQYQARGVVPPLFYIDQLMEYLKKPYYISLLSAAELYGAAHQRPQRFSVTTIRPVMNTSKIKNQYIVWNYRSEIPSVLLRERNSETGTIRFSSPELTVADLIQYEHKIGGLSVAATVIAELVENTDFSRCMEELLKVASLSAIQRLGYILEDVLEEYGQAGILYEQLRKLNKRLIYIPLSRKADAKEIDRNTKWKIIINQSIEIDDI